MKTAISLPDPLFRAAEREAKRLGVSRSKLLQVALREFLSRKKARQLTEEINRAVAKHGDPSDEMKPILDAALVDIFANNEWDE
jgi:metal-responsive CopG/Arc/MetJ family transcriptional regulator